MSPVPAGVDPITGELMTLDDVNRNLIQLSNVLDKTATELEQLSVELVDARLAYDVQYAAVVASSTARSEDRRKAEALITCTKVFTDSGESLASRQARLDIQVRTLKDAGHNIRARMSSIQSVGSNIRTIMDMAGKGGM